MWALVHLPLFFFCPQPCGASLDHKCRVRDGEVDSSFLLLSPPSNLILFVTHHHTWTHSLSLSLSPIMKIKWMVRAFMGRSCFPRERGMSTCVVMWVCNSPTFFTLSDCPCTEFNFGLTLMLNYRKIYDFTPTTTSHKALIFFSLYHYVFAFKILNKLQLTIKLSMMLQKKKEG